MDEINRLSELKSNLENDISQKAEKYEKEILSLRKSYEKAD